MKVDKVRVGLVGLGLVSDSHIKGYLSNPNAQIIAACDLDEQRAKAVASEFGIGKYYTSYDAMLADPEINTVDITTPTFLHASMSIAAAKAGKNIMCEKPFALTLADADAMVKEAQGRGVTLMVGESYVFMTSIMKAREIIEAGEIGKPQQMRERVGAWVERPGALDSDRQVTDLHRGWRMDTKRAGGAGFPWMYDHCVHFFATAKYLMNGTNIKEVYSLKSDISWMTKVAIDETEMNIYHPEKTRDIPIIAWTYDDPACHGVWMRAEPLNGKYDPMYGFLVTVIGEKGMIEVLGEGGKGLLHQGKDVHLVLHRKDGGSQTFRFDEGGDDIWQSEVSYYSRAHINQINEFVAALISGHAPRYTGIDGLRDIKTTMAAICSAKEGVPVQVSEITDQRFKR
jgi:predicted dehydrogenase